MKLHHERLIMPVKAIPEGFRTVTPYLAIRGVAEVITFLTNAFDAKEMYAHRQADGSIMHAQVQIGDSIIMLGEACGDYQPMPGMLYLYVEDVDALYKKAIAAGGKSVKEPSDQFYGDRNAAVVDSGGNQWWLATHVENVSEDELSKGAEQFRNHS